MGIKFVILIIYWYLLGVCQGEKIFVSTYIIIWVDTILNYNVDTRVFLSSMKVLERYMDLNCIEKELKK